MSLGVQKTRQICRRMNGECHCWWTNETRSVLRASNFPRLKFIEIVILWVYYTIPIGVTLFWHVWASLFNFLKYFVWRRITDEGSVPEMLICSILLIKSNLKCSVHLSRSLLLNFNYLVSVTCWLTNESPGAHVAKFYGRLRLIRSVLRASNFPRLKFIEIVILWVHYTTVTVPSHK